MKKIAIDTLPLVSGHAARGTGVYTKRLIESLEKEIKKHKNISLDKFVFKENTEKLTNYDLLHYPYFDIFYRTLTCPSSVKTVVTVHDVTPLLYPKYYPPGIKGKINFYIQKKALSSVDAVITISETSKKDIVRFLDIPKEKIFPIYEAPNFIFKKQSDNFVSKVKKKYGLPEKFILYIGDVNWNKNIIRLVQAAKKLNVTLVIVGKAATNKDYDKTHIENQPLRELQEKYGNDMQIMRLGYVEDNELNAIWQLASIYCFPSLYEGFGLSALEAMSAGVALVCSKTQALVEVVGDAAVYFDPASTEDIADKLNEVLSNKELQNKLKEKGRKRVQEFSWQKAATQTLSIYKKVLGL